MSINHVVVSVFWVKSTAFPPATPCRQNVTPVTACVMHDQFWILMVSEGQLPESEPTRYKFPAGGIAFCNKREPALSG